MHNLTIVVRCDTELQARPLVSNRVAWYMPFQLTIHRNSLLMLRTPPMIASFRQAPLALQLLPPHAQRRLSSSSLRSIAHPHQTQGRM